MSTATGPPYVRQAVAMALAKPALQNLTSNSLPEYEALSRIPLTAARDAATHGLTSCDVAFLFYSIGIHEQFRNQRATALEFLGKAKRLYAKLSERIPLAMTLRAIGNLHVARARYRSAQRRFDRALSLLSDQDAESVELARTLAAYAYLHMRCSRFTDAEDMFVRAGRMFEACLDSNDERHDVVEVRGNLAEIYRVLGRYGEAEQLLLDTVSDRLVEPHPLPFAEFTNKLAQLYRDLLSFDEAHQRDQLAADRLRQSHYDRHPSYARTLISMATTRQACENYEEAERLFSDALRILRLSLGDQHPEVATVLCRRGDLYAHKSSFQAASADYRQAEMITDIGEHEYLRAQVRLCKGRLSDKLGEPREAILEYQAALAQLRALYGGRHPLVANAMVHVAATQQQLGQLQDAKTTYEEALSIQCEALGARHFTYADTLIKYGLLLRALGMADESHDRILEGGKIRDNSVGPGVPVIAAFLQNLTLYFNDTTKKFTASELPAPHAALVARSPSLPLPIAMVAMLQRLADPYCPSPRYDELVACYDESIEILIAARGPDHPVSLMADSDWSYLLYILNEKDAARVKATTCIERAIAVLGEQHLVVAHALGVLGQIEIALERYSPALSCYRRAKAIFRNELGVDHRLYAGVLHDLAIVFLRLKRFRRAESLFLASYNTFEKSVGKNSIECAFALNGVGVLLEEMRRTDDARKYFSRALETARAAVGPGNASTRMIKAHLDSLS